MTVIARLSGLRPAGALSAAFPDMGKLGIESNPTQS